MSRLTDHVMAACGKISLHPCAAMIAKKTSKNQLTLPKKVVERFPGVDYFDVRVGEGTITLVPVRADRLTQVQARLEEMGLSERDVQDAVAWARSRRR